MAQRSEASEAERAYAQRLVRTYFAMLTVGCQDARCTNACCRSSTQAPALSAADAAIRSIYLATQAPVAVCEALQGLLQPQQQSTPVSALEAEPIPSMETLESTAASQPETADVQAVETRSEEEKVSGASGAVIRCSTPRRRLSTAVRLDLGLNPATKAGITQIVVQPKHPPPLTPNNASTDSRASLGDVPPAVDTHQAPTAEPKAAKNPRYGPLSRPKQKLLDAIKRSFSRARKTPLSST